MNANFYYTAPVPSWTSRFYETEHDLQQMQGLLMEARSRTDGWRYWHVGELIFGFFMVACHLNPQEHIRLWHDDEGKLVGYAILSEDPTFDWQGLPGDEWGGNLNSGVRQDNAERIAFLDQNGFKYMGEYAEVNMLRSLEELILDPVI